MSSAIERPSTIMPLHTKWHGPLGRLPPSCSTLARKTVHADSQRSWQYQYAISCAWSCDPELFFKFRNPLFERHLWLPPKQLFCQRIVSLGVVCLDARRAIGDVTADELGEELDRHIATGTNVYYLSVTDPLALHRHEIGSYNVTNMR